MMKREEKREKGFKRGMKPEMAIVDFEELFYETVLEIAEASEKPVGRARRRIAKTRLRDQIVHAESWPERDRLLKSLAAKCYDVANSFIESDADKALKWMRIVAKLLSLSFVPKRLEDLELVKKEVAEVKAQMHELEMDEGEYEDDER
jgi:hypothetical protein